ncbi:hypothetical protein EJD97_002603 [Solanum chilense]|uniref:Retrotransposon Copia-like N-terminal domain-containing protein n=1 Tax=Solanum chilense TaxID=4083 RepID=A0A6N2BWW7_SOLCI|nr:hypothetical protein EJD97_002603 [Solanum chilense]
MANHTVTTLGHNHPLHLQPTNTPCVSLITRKLTGLENYVLRRRTMRLALLVKNKIGFIDGFCLKSMYKDGLAVQWERCNAVVLSWISSTITSNMLMTIVYASNAKRVWEDFKETFDKSNLMKPSINQAYAIVIQEESQRLLGEVDSNKEPLTMMVGRGQGQGFKGTRLVGYPSDFKSKRKQSDSSGSYQNNIEGFKSPGSYSNNAYNNSGNFKPYANNASMDKQKQDFEFTKEEYNQIKNLLHNKEPSDCKGNLTGDTHHVASYEELMYSELSFRVSLFPHFCVLQELYSAEVIGIGKEVYGLYLLQGANRARVNSASTSIKDENLNYMWHFGHGLSSIQVMEQIPYIRKHLNITTKLLSDMSCSKTK